MPLSSAAAQRARKMLACITACVCIGCICVVCAVTAQDAMDFKQLPEGSSSCIMHNSSRVDNVTARGQADCAMQCVQSRDFVCRSILFDEQTGVCQLRDGQDGQFVRQSEPSPTTPNITVTRGNRTFRVIQQRLKGHIYFIRNWKEYDNGFGDNCDFWIGLKAISEMTATPRLLRVEMTRWSGSVYVAEYDGFNVGDASTNYTMTYSSYSNINMTYNSLDHSKGMPFSTMDAEHDLDPNRYCAAGTGGWWFRHCSNSNLNGNINDTTRYRRMLWHGAGGSDDALKQSLMLLLV